MRLRNGVGSKREIVRTASVRPSGPHHNPGPAVPIGVTAPTPVITTRRKLFMVGLRSPFDSCQRARRNTVDEHRTDHEIRRELSDQRPTRSGPVVHDLYVYYTIPSTILHQPPHNLHTLCHSPHVAITDFTGRPVDRHLGDPPGRILPGAERPPCRHFHEAVVQQSDPPVVREDGGPAGHGAGGAEDAVERGRDAGGVYGQHTRLSPASPPL